MDYQALFDDFLKFLQVFLSWPPIVLFIVLYFQKEIRTVLPILSKRLRRASFVGNTLEFSEMDVKAISNAIESGAEQLKDKPEELVKFVKNQVGKLPSVGSKKYLDFSVFSKRSILWVDDEPLNNYIEMNLFKQYGSHINFVNSTDEAKTILRLNSFDLIISDIHRIENAQSNPDAGYELLEYLKGQNIKIPLIFYTGSVRRVNLSKAKGAFGMVDEASDLFAMAIDALTR